LPPDHAAEFSLAVNEIATNAIRYGGGTATVTITTDGGRVTVEVSDRGSGMPANVTADLPSPDQIHGRGLWLARQLCDELTVRSIGSGTLVRLSATPVSHSSGQTHPRA
jgi:anti-sigma regulatory factor (Ser/Thr protein kinase)